jgi:hypothetical protein
MKPRHNSLRTKVFRVAVVCGSFAWGVGELFALQRSRYHQWRVRA